MNNARILLVEDDGFIRDVFEEILVDEGYEVVVATDGEDGLMKMVQGHWDVILLDYMMPKLNGIQMMQKIRDEKIQVDCKYVYFLTNMDDEKERMMFNELGNGYFIKSDLTPPILVEKIKAILATPTPPRPIV